MENNQAVEAMWLEASNGSAPSGSLLGGHDITGEPIYVARASHRDNLIPGKLVTSHGCAFVSWGGEEFKKNIYEVLVGSTNIWVPARGSKIPTRSFAGGHTKEGEPLYVGRVHYKGTITPGKVYQSQGLCNIAFGGQELSFSDYEILTY